MSELLPFCPPPKIQKQGLTNVQKIIPSHSQPVCQNGYKLGPVNVQIITLLAPQKFKSKDLEMSKKSYPPTASMMA